MTTNTTITSPCQLQPGAMCAVQPRGPEMAASDRLALVSPGIWLALAIGVAAVAGGIWLGKWMLAQADAADEKERQLVEARRAATLALRTHGRLPTSAAVARAEDAIATSAAAASAHADTVLAEARHPLEASRLLRRSGIDGVEVHFSEPTRPVPFRVAAAGR